MHVPPRHENIRFPDKSGSGHSRSLFGAPTTLMVLLALVAFVCIPAHATPVIALIDAAKEDAFTTLMEPFGHAMELLPTLGNHMPPKLFLMLTTQEPLDIVFDTTQRLPDYARNGLLRSLDSYMENREHFKRHKEQLLITDGDVYGYVHGVDRVFINRTAAWGVAVTRNSQLTNEVVDEIMQLVLQAGPATPASPQFEARRAATLLLQYMYIDKDYKTALVYVHPSRQSGNGNGPVHIDADGLAHLAREGYYSRLNVTSVLATEVTEIARWENPYDGKVYDHVFEVRMRLTHRSSNAMVPHELFVHVQEVDGEWLVFVSQHGFE